MLLLPRIPSDYQILFLDMDAFFASCEQQLRPELRNRPIGVVPQLIDSTCILSPSYEAKRLGIKTGIGVRQAQLLCPSIQLVEARPEIYKKIHYQIYDILGEVSPWTKAHSIDEFSVVLSPSEQNEKSAQTITAYIKNRIYHEIGPYNTTSIGFAPNRFLAKVAGEIHKPDGLGIITLHNLEDVLSSLQLTDLPGIARNMEGHLHGMGIYTTRQLFHTSAATLRRQFGFPGEMWWYRLHGYEIDPINHKRASIGHSHVLAPQWRSPQKAYQVLTRLVHKTGMRLRHEGFYAQDTHLYIGHINAPPHYAHLHTHAYCDTTTAINLAEQLWKTRPSTLNPILHLAFTFTGLVKYDSQPISLFRELEKPTRLSEALDSVNDKYGRDSIFPASMLNAKETAPDRIPFGEVRY